MEDLQIERVNYPVFEVELNLDEATVTKFNKAVTGRTPSVLELCIVHKYIEQEVQRKTGKTVTEFLSGMHKLLA